MAESKRHKSERASVYTTTAGRIPQYRAPNISGYLRASSPASILLRQRNVRGTHQAFPRQRDLYDAHRRNVASENTPIVAPLIAVHDGAVGVRQADIEMGEGGEGEKGENEEEEEQKEAELPRLPSGDLLRAIHAYASDFYACTEGAAVGDPANGRILGATAGTGTGTSANLDFRSMDETALIAMGVLLEEILREDVLGETGDLAFTEGDGGEALVFGGGSHGSGGGRGPGPRRKGLVERNATRGWLKSRQEKMSGVGIQTEAAEAETDDEGQMETETEAKGKGKGKGKTANKGARGKGEGGETEAETDGLAAATKKKTMTKKGKKRKGSGGEAEAETEGGSTAKKKVKSRGAGGKRRKTDGAEAGKE